jgi:putative ABC transport system permease protein
MFSNYIKVALRRLRHYKIYSLINVLDLALGLCSCLVIWIIVQHELALMHFRLTERGIYQINTLSR